MNKPTAEVLTPKRLNRLGPEMELTLHELRLEQILRPVPKKKGGGGQGATNREYLELCELALRG